MAPAPDDDLEQWPPGITADDAPALDALAAAGWGEGDGDNPHVPDGLLDLYEVLEWQAAVAAEAGQ